jgi:hypothetical protein
MPCSRLRAALAFSVTHTFLLGSPLGTFARGGGRGTCYAPRPPSPETSHRSDLSSSRGSAKYKSCQQDNRRKITRVFKPVSELRQTSPALHVSPIQIGPHCHLE